MSTGLREISPDDIQVALERLLTPTARQSCSPRASRATARASWTRTSARGPAVRTSRAAVQQRRPGVRARRTPPTGSRGRSR